MRPRSSICICRVINESISQSKTAMSDAPINDHDSSFKVISRSTLSDTIGNLATDFATPSLPANEPFADRDRMFVLWPNGMRATRVMVVLGFESG